MMYGTENLVRKKRLYLHLLLKRMHERVQETRRMRDLKEARARLQKASARLKRNSCGSSRTRYFKDTYAA